MCGEQKVTPSEVQHSYETEGWVLVGSARLALALGVPPWLLTFPNLTQTDVTGCTQYFSTQKLKKDRAESNWEATFVNSRLVHSLRPKRCAWAEGPVGTAQETGRASP